MRDNCKCFSSLYNISVLHPDYKTQAFGHCVIFSEHKGYRPPYPPKSEGAPTPIVALNSPGEILNFCLLRDFFNKQC